MLFAVVLAAALGLQSAPQHTTHYPRHGGQLFPIASDTLHIEGTWPSQRVFRLYVYDVDSRPLPIERLRAITARVEASGATSSLVLREKESYFEARIPSLKAPAQLAVQLALADGKSDGVLFIFPANTDDRAMTFALQPTVIPPTIALTVAALGADINDANLLMEQHQSAYVFGAAIRVRDHSLSLERFLPSLGESRLLAESKIREAVRTSWLLHLAADEGTLLQTQTALEEMRRAVEELTRTFDTPRQ